MKIGKREGVLPTWSSDGGVGPALLSAAEQATITVSTAPRARAANLRGHFVIIYSRWR